VYISMSMQPRDQTSAGVDQPRPRMTWQGRGDDRVLSGSEHAPKACRAAFLPLAPCIGACR
jgi:hypothetical protein